MQLDTESSDLIDISKLSAITSKYHTASTICILLAIIFISAFLKGKWGIIGEDSDDVLRLVQIKDYLAGQSWFHTDQYRMGLAGGTDMHWSRIPDIPIILLTHVFDLFMPQERALVLAFTLWPPMTAALLIWSCLIGARFWGGNKNRLFTTILLAIFLMSYYRFMPGAIDHHNLQIGFLAMSMAFILDPDLRFKSYFISGCAAGISVAIGVEVVLFIAVICVFIALKWMIRGKPEIRAVQGFGFGFSLMLLLAFFGTIAPSEYSLIYCDALSLITVSAGVVGALGLVLITKIDQQFNVDNKLQPRIMSLTILALLCAAILVFQAPQCLANPLDSLPENVMALWLDNVSEARSITQMGSETLTVIPFMLGAPIMALISLIWYFNKTHSKDIIIRDSLTSTPSNYSKTLPPLLILMALALALYQTRFHVFAYIFAIIPLAAWTAQIFVRTKAKNPDSFVYLLALILSVPASWTVPGLLLERSKAFDVTIQTKKKSANCSSPSVAESLKALPKGTILADSDITGFILDQTSHRALSGNYHRNWQGISTEIQISISDIAAARRRLSELDIDYLYYCAGAVGTDTYIKNNENGLMAKIAEGEFPEFLELVSPPDLENGEVKIFKIDL